MFKFLLVALVALTFWSTEAAIFYSHSMPIGLDSSPYVFERQTVQTQPITVELKNSQCYPRACDYVARTRLAEPEHVVFTYSTQVHHTRSRPTCTVGRDFIVRHVEVACDNTFCSNNGFGIKATRSCGIEYCECATSGQALLKMCPVNTIFHPQYLTCVHPFKVYGCLYARR